MPPAQALAESRYPAGLRDQPRGRARRPSPEPAGVVEIQVAGGPAAGSLHRLTLGEAESAAPAAPRTPDRRPAAAGHGAARVGGRPGPVHGRALRRRAGRAGPRAAGRPGALAAGTAGHGGRHAAGAGPLRAAGRGSAHLGGWAGVDFNRPPRLLPPERMTRFELPRPPARPERRPAPILMAVIPVLLGVAMAYFLHQIYMLAVCALSPVMLLGTFVTDRRHGRRSYAQQMADYAGHKARIEQDAQEALDAERVQRRAGGPDSAVVLTIASGPRRRLWERRRTDPDYLLLRVGTADLPSAVELADPTQDEHRRQVFWTVPDAPVSVPLAQRGVLGIAGPGEAPRSLGRWLLAQAAVLHSPNDLQIYVLTDSSGQASWGWASWLPHCRPADGRAVALIGNDAETVAARIADLLAIIAARQRARRESGLAGVTFGRRTSSWCIDGSRRLRSLPGAIPTAPRRAADEGVCGLPGHRRAAAARRVPGRRRGRAGRGWCLPLARSISPVRDVSDADEASVLRIRPGCWTCWNWSRPQHPRSRCAGARAAAAPRWPCWVSRMTGRSASTSAKTARTR